MQPAPGFPEKVFLFFCPGLKTATRCHVGRRFNLQEAA